MSNSSRSGILNIHKPRGLTSRAIVNDVQSLVQPEKVGHAGTLDPLATGVLLVCIGKATRLIEHIQRLPKTYRAMFLFGRRSETEDIEGDVELLPTSRVPTLAEIEAILPKFVGSILQRPPIFSALKVQGKRAYQLARRGKEVVLAERPVSIHALHLLRYSYPEIELDICCSSGTYIRSLGRDIALAAGTEGVMSALQRTDIGPYSVKDSVRMNQVELKGVADFVLPAESAVAELPVRTLTDEELARFACGLTITTPETSLPAEWAMFDARSSFVGIATQIAPTELRASINFVAKN